MKRENRKPTRREWERLTSSRPMVRRMSMEAADRTPDVLSPRFNASPNVTSTQLDVPLSGGAVPGRITLAHGALSTVTGIYAYTVGWWR